jgi:hypothetical protein
MIEPLLKLQLEPVARRSRKLMRRRGLAYCWLASALVGLGFILLERFAGWGAALVLPALGVAAGIAAIRILWRVSQWEPDYRQIARQIEQHHPDLHALLLTAVEQQPDAKTGQLHYLQERVIQDALAEAKKRKWIETVSGSRLVGMQLAQLAALAALGLVLLNLRHAPGVLGRLSFASDRSVQVTPGDTSIEKGSGLVVFARFNGPLPADATLVTVETPDKNRRIPLVKNLADPVFGGGITEVNADLLYHIEYAGRQTRDFKVRVFEHPRLERADARITYPDYTGLTEKEIKDTRRVTAVEGSQLDVSFFLNKPVASAKLIARDKSVVPLATDTNKPIAALNPFTIAASQTYELQLVDAEGRTNKVPAQFIIEALKNRPPELKIASPRGDQRVSPLEEISFQAQAWDDYGLRDYGLTYTVAGGEPKTIVLGTNAPANEKRQLTYLLSLEDIAAQPDQLISYFVWADDIGPDGKGRRTASDRFFAEVRPFEEIFRDGPPQESAGGQGKENESTKLAELQKQIINATWKLQRQQSGKEATAQYKQDATVVEKSQEQALEKAEQLKERASDSRTQALVANVEDEMNKAVDQLTKAADSPAPLPKALAAEESAYQALMKLAAHEFMVSESRGKNGGGGGQPSQQQLEQLDLKHAEDRYETQSQATPQQSEEQREQLQILNRLKELAQRQQDLNEKLKGLQNALQEAKTDQEREEIRRRLKRLREEEQEMLADVDELKQKMEQAQNQSSMAEARQQLDKTRSEVQRAGEALDQEAVSQALSEGTRAQRDLQQLRDELRQKGASQFTDEMRQMRADARELARKEEELAKQLDSLAETKHKTLTDSGETKQLAEQFQQQASGLTNLLDHVRNVSEQSETAEPLLSKQLYDTLRKSSQGTAENSLKTSEELVKRNFVSEAAPFEQKARQEINEVKEGVERAAESVLGNDTEALRLARRELDDLTRQLENEIAQADPKLAQASGQRPNSEQNADPSAASKAGQPQPNQPGNGQQQDPQDAKPGDKPNNNSAQNPTGQADDPQNQQAGGKPNDPSGQAGGEKAQQSAAQKSPQDQQRQAAGNSPEKGAQAQNGQAQGNPAGKEPTSTPQQGQGKGQGQGEGQQAAQNAQGQGQGQGKGQPAANPPQQASTRQQPAPNQQNQPGQAGNQPGAGGRQARNLLNQPGQQGGNGGPHRPITGEAFVEWSDRLRNVEEILDLPDLRNEVATARDHAREMRVEFKKSGRKPDWAVVQTQIADRLVEVRSRINEELARRESSEALVPIDRDPVPAKFSDLVRRYYEKLGSGE